MKSPIFVFLGFLLFCQISVAADSKRFPGACHRTLDPQARGQNLLDLVEAIMEADRGRSEDDPGSLFNLNLGAMASEQSYNQAKKEMHLAVEQLQRLRATDYLISRDSVVELSAQIRSGQISVAMDVHLRFSDVQIAGLVRGNDQAWLGVGLAVETIMTEIISSPDTDINYIIQRHMLNALASNGIPITAYRKLENTLKTITQRIGEHQQALEEFNLAKANLRQALRDEGLPEDTFRSSFDPGNW